MQLFQVKLGLWLANTLPEIKEILISFFDIYRRKCKKIYPWEDQKKNATKDSKNRTNCEVGGAVSPNSVFCHGPTRVFDVLMFPILSVALTYCILSVPQLYAVRPPTVCCPSPQLYSVRPPNKCCPFPPLYVIHPLLYLLSVSPLYAVFSPSPNPT